MLNPSTKNNPSCLKGPQKKYQIWFQVGTHIWNSYLELITKIFLLDTFNLLIKQIKWRLELCICVSFNDFVCHCWSQKFLPPPLITARVKFKPRRPWFKKFPKIILVSSARQRWPEITFFLRRSYNSWPNS